MKQVDERIVIADEIPIDSKHKTSNMHQELCDKMVLGQNGRGQKVWTKWYGQNGTDRINQAIQLPLTI